MSVHSSIKEDVACSHCEMVCEDPITFPCGCLLCSVHLSDHFAKDGKIKCQKCAKFLSHSRRVVIRKLKYAQKL